MIEQYSNEIINYIKNNPMVDIFPRYNDREEWDKLPNNLTKIIINNGEQYIGYVWPQLKASDYLDFFNDGIHRGKYHISLMKRRNTLGELLMAECVEGKGRFMKDIINGIFCICEESTWVVPQHNAILNRSEMIDKHIPCRKTGHIDLFAAETGSLLSWCLYFLKEPLDKISFNICNRIREELEYRIIKPYLASDEFHWMGFLEGTGHHGNWNPWINCNCMITYLFGCRHEALQIEGIQKVIISMQKYIDSLGEDGGCSEGPVYWTVAAGMVFDAMEILYLITGKSIDLFNNNKFRNMGSFIYQLYIGENYYVNFADAPAKDHGNKDGGLLYRYGLASDDSNLKNLGVLAFKRNLELNKKRPNFQLSHSNNSFRAYRNFSNLFRYQEIQAITAKPPYIKDKFISDIQVAVGREEEGSGSGFFICAKGGNNAESHNHNDVGHFVAFYDKKPVFVDPGALPYSLDYFHENRYTYWATQSGYHNLPIINGMMQDEGHEAAATNVTYATDDIRMEVSMNIENAYPEEAKVKCWNRTYKLERKEKPCIKIIDSFTLDEVSDDVSLSLITPRQVRVKGDNEIVLEAYEGSPALLLILEKDKFDIEIQTKDLSNIEKLSDDWGESLYRIQLKAKNLVINENWTMTIVPELS